MNEEIHEHKAAERDYWGNPVWVYEKCSCGKVRYNDNGYEWTEWMDLEKEVANMSIKR